MNKNIIIAGIAAIGLYLFSRQKKTVYKTPDIPQIKKIAEKIPEATTPAARKKIAEKKAAAEKAAEKAAAEKAAEKAAFTPEIKLAIAILSTTEKIQALVAYRKKIAAEKNVSPQSISLTPDQRARVLLEAAIKKAAQKIKARRAEMARYAKRQRPQIQRPNPNKKQTTSKLFPGAERSRIIPYSESSKHSYYGPKSHKLQNEGYMVEWQKRHYNSVEAYHNRKLLYVLSHPKYWKK